MNVKFRLMLMNFMQFFIWGSWLITIGNAQGLFMMMVNGFGALSGSFTSGPIIDKFFTFPYQSKDRQNIWITIASHTLLLAAVFPFIFKYKHNKAEISAIEAMNH